MDRITFYIHTYGRVHKQITLNRLSKAVKESTYLVVQKREAHRYNYPNLVILPDHIQTLSPTRQWLLDNARTNQIVLMDDDLAFYRRKSPTDWHLRYTTEPDLDRLFYGVIPTYLREYVHCGISPREGNNRVEKLEIENCRAMRILGYNVNEVHKVGARFDRVETKQDFDMTLQLLRAGHKNIVSYEYAQGQWSGSQAEGGCSEYRTKEMMDACAEKLAELHPGFVKIREKKTKTAWKEFGNVRKDVTIFWKKAYESSKT